MKVDRLDHLVLTVRDVDATCRFYESALGMKTIAFGDGRRALAFGDQKINLHQIGQEIAPHATRPTQGSADLCFTTLVPIADVARHLKERDIAIELGPILRTGARGPLESLYFRDPDGNLLEVSNEVSLRP